MPCQFNSLPTNGNCEAAVGFIIKSGFHGDVRLDGVKMAFTAKWPGPIHLGNGTVQLIVDVGAISLDHNKDSHAYICRIYMNGQGVIEHAA